MKRIVLTAALAMLALGLVAGPASAQYPDAADIQLSDASIDCPSGETLTITGEGFLPNEPAVRIFLDGEEIARVFPSSTGTFSVTVDPPSAAAGTHLIEARQFIAAEEPDEIVATATLTCVGGAAVAFTGPTVNISVGVIILAGLIVVGLAALVAGRRRARRAG